MRFSLHSQKWTSILFVWHGSLIHMINLVKLLLSVFLISWYLLYMHACMSFLTNTIILFLNYYYYVHGSFHAWSLLGYSDCLILVYIYLCFKICSIRRKPEWNMSTFEGVFVNDQWLQSQFTQVELRKLRTKVCNYHNIPVLYILSYKNMYNFIDSHIVCFSKKWIWYGHNTRFAARFGQIKAL